MISLTAQGEYEFRVVGGNRDGQVLNRSKNLITDYGLDQLVGNNGGWYYYQQFMAGCYVGSGPNAPTGADLSLGNQKAATTTVQADIPSAGNVTPTTDATTRFYELTRTFRFPVFTSDANLTEVGVGPNSNQLCSRALIVDGGGNPTTITVLNGEQIDVTYKLRVTYPTKDYGTSSSNCGAGSVTISGTSYNYTVYQHGLLSASTVNCMWPGILACYDADFQIRTAADASLTYPGSALPTPIAANATKSKQDAGKLRLTFTVPLNHATSGIGRIMVNPSNGTYVTFVFVFDKVIPKDASSTFTMNIDYQVTAA